MDFWTKFKAQALTLWLWLLSPLNGMLPDSGMRHAIGFLVAFALWLIVPGLFWLALLIFLAVSLFRAAKLDDAP